MTLCGRARERAAIEGLLADAREGRSGVLVLRGDPGIGKSALLAYAGDAVRGAGDMRVLRAVGVAGERDLAFAGLHQLLRPVLHLADRLPGPQAGALASAFGLSAGRAGDRFLVAVAVLSLLAEAADDRPVLCLVDDAHWLDRSSAEALTFVARRLEAEGVAMLVATRREALAGIASRWLDGLERSSALELLAAHALHLETDVRDRLIEETGGNPLALVELAGSVSARELAGPGPLRLSDRVQNAFLDQMRRLPEPTRRLLLVAAGDDTGDTAMILRAARDLGVPDEALGPAERVGLIRLDGEGRLTFRHPLLRSAVYHDAPLAERLAVHRVLAGASSGRPDRRAWQLAAAAFGPDENVAADLERSADEARRRRGHAAASAAFERAAELSVTSGSRARRLAAACRDAYDAGQLDRAAALARRTDALATDVRVRAEITALRGGIEVARSAPAAALPLLMEAARLLAERDPEQTALILVDAQHAAESSCSARNMAVATAGFAALRLPADHPLGPLVTAHLGFGEFYARRFDPGMSRIREGIDGLLRAGRAGIVRYLPKVTAPSELAIAIGDDVAGLALTTATVEHCRTLGLVGRLPFALGSLALVEMQAGRFAAARSHAVEGLRLARDLRQEFAGCLCTALLSWFAAVRGDEDECRRLVAESAGTGSYPTIAETAPGVLGKLELTLGRPEQAFERISDTVDRLFVNFPFVDIYLVADLVEAAFRCGRADRAAEALVRFERWADHAGQAWADAVCHRCRALLAAGGPEAEEHFRTALRRHDEVGQTDRAFDRARTELLYGEWLRRGRRRAEARSHLALAHEIFERLDLPAWTNRAAAELRATGQTPRRRNPSTARQLTPQELLMVRLAAAGGSNKDIAAQLFLSPRTVGYHLSNAFAKLGIASRRELARLDFDSQATGAGGPPDRGPPAPGLRRRA